MPYNLDTCAIKRGDVIVFEKVYRTNVRMAFLCAASWAENDVIAQEAVQESFIKLWEGRENLNPEYDIKHYLLKSIRNYILNHKRHQKIREIKQEDIIREELFLRTSNSSNSNSSGNMEKILAVMNELPDSCRQTFLMAVVNGLSYEETALEMGVSKNTVKTQIKIAYKRIRSSFELLLLICS